MKSNREHRVPLSSPAMALLEQLAPIRDGSGSVFISQRRGGRMSDTTLSAVLKRMGRGELTVHGFRSTFRDWAAEATGHPNHVVEMALAHTIGSAVERAYRRGDLFEKRRTLMDEWAAYLTRPARDGIRVIEPSDAGCIPPAARPAEPPLSEEQEALLRRVLLQHPGLPRWQALRGGGPVRRGGLLPASLAPLSCVCVGRRLMAPSGPCKVCFLELEQAVGPDGPAAFLLAENRPASAKALKSFAIGHPRARR
jgi:hypothetical protein